MQFKAIAKTPGRCAWRLCKASGNRIYQDGEYKYLTCCMEHANNVRAEIDKIPEELRDKIIFK